MTTALIIKYGGYIAALIVGILMYLFPARRKELDAATAKLIKTLQETVSALEERVEISEEKTLRLEDQQHENMKKIDAMEIERQLLKDFIAGRDKETKEFQAEAMRLHRDNSQSIRQLVEMLNKHFITMEQAALK